MNNVFKPRSGVMAIRMTVVAPRGGGGVVSAGLLRRILMRQLFTFSGKRWQVFGAIIGLIYFIAFFGVWVAVFIPFVGGPLFLIGLMVWYVPGIVLNWTGYFKFHEFGAAPTGWERHVIMFLFYALIAFLLSWPFGRRKENRPPH